MKTLLKVLAALGVAATVVATSLVVVRAVSRMPLQRHVSYRVSWDQESSGAVTPQSGDFRTPEWDRARWESSSVLRVGQDYTLRATDAARDVQVVFGSATIEGHVYEDAVAVFGPVRLGPTAVIDGALIVVGDRVTIEPGAVIRGDLVVIGGVLDAPTGFAPGGQHIVVGASGLGEHLRTVLPWFTRGLLWGRPIVPGLSWVWAVVGVFGLLYLLVNLLLHRPVAASVEVMRTRPLSTFLVGLLVLLLVGPVSLLLALSVIGLVVVPFALCAMLVAGVIGKVGVLRWIGSSAFAVDDAENRLQALRSFAIGFVLITAVYMVPVIGLLAWALAGTFGLGAAVLAFLSGLRRENPRPARPPAPPPVAPPYGPVSPLVTPEPPPAAFDPPPVPAAPVTPPGADDLRGFPHASFTDRLAAFALDIVIVAIGSQLLDLNFDRHPGPTIILMLAYYIVFWAWKGTSMGGIICNLRVVLVDGAPLQFADALVRGLSSFFSFAALGLGCFWILRDPERQAWHDRIAGTYVVKVPKSWPLP